MKGFVNGIITMWVILNIIATPLVAVEPVNNEKISFSSSEQIIGLDGFARLSKLGKELPQVAEPVQPITPKSSPIKSILLIIYAMAAGILILVYRSKKLYLVLFAVSVGVLLYSAKDTVAAPEAYSFSDYAKYNSVDTSSGDLSISLPLFSIVGKGGLSYSVGMSYHAGIKLDQQASEVGLGWVLDLPNVIRGVNGIPDDIYNEVNSTYLYYQNYPAKWSGGLLYNQWQELQRAKAASYAQSLRFNAQQALDLKSRIDNVGGDLRISSSIKQQQIKNPGVANEGTPVGQGFMGMAVLLVSYIENFYSLQQHWKYVAQQLKDEQDLIRAFTNINSNSKKIDTFLGKIYSYPEIVSTTRVQKHTAFYKTITQENKLMDYNLPDTYFVNSPPYLGNLILSNSKADAFEDRFIPTAYSSNSINYNPEFYETERQTILDGYDTKLKFETENKFTTLINEINGGAIDGFYIVDKAGTRYLFKNKTEEFITKNFPEFLPSDIPLSFTEEYSTFSWKDLFPGGTLSENPSYLFKDDNGRFGVAEAILTDHSTRWGITKIYDANKAMGQAGDEVSFYYENVPLIDGVFTVSNSMRSFVGSRYADVSDDYSVSSTGHKFITRGLKKMSLISNITTSLQKIRFIYNYSRNDGKEAFSTTTLDGLPKLDEILLYSLRDSDGNGIDEEIPVEKYIFKYDYSLAVLAPDNPSSGGRLTLKQIEHCYFNYTGWNCLDPIKMEYAKNNPTPPINSNRDSLLSSKNPYYIRNYFDRWGYFYFSDNLFSDMHNAEGKQNSWADAWSLTKISWPTGGTTEFIYEEDRYNYINDYKLEKTKYGGGIRVAKVINCNGLVNSFGDYVCLTQNYAYVDKSPNLISKTPSGKIIEGVDESSGVAFGEPAYPLYSGDYVALEKLVDTKYASPIQSNSYGVIYGKVQSYINNSIFTSGVSTVKYTTLRDYPAAGFFTPDIFIDFYQWGSTSSNGGQRSEYSGSIGLNNIEFQPSYVKDNDIHNNVMLLNENGKYFVMSSERGYLFLIKMISGGTASNLPVCNLYTFIDHADNEPPFINKTCPGEKNKYCGEISFKTQTQTYDRNERLTDELSFTSDRGYKECKQPGTMLIFCPADEDGYISVNRDKNHRGVNPILNQNWRKLVGANLIDQSIDRWNAIRPGNNLDDVQRRLNLLPYSGTCLFIYGGHWNWGSKESGETIKLGNEGTSCIQDSSGHCILNKYLTGEFNIGKSFKSYLIGVPNESNMYSPNNLVVPISSSTKSFSFGQDSALENLQIFVANSRLNWEEARVDNLSIRKEYGNYQYLTGIPKTTKIIGNDVNKTINVKLTGDSGSPYLDEMGSPKMHILGLAYEESILGSNSLYNNWDFNINRSWKKNWGTIAGTKSANGAMLLSAEKSYLRTPNNDEQVVGGEIVDYDLNLNPVATKDTKGILSFVYYGSNEIACPDQTNSVVSLYTVKAVSGKFHNSVPTCVENNAGQKAMTKYDDKYRIIESIGPNNESTKYQYDNLGRLWKILLIGNEDWNNPDAEYSYEFYKDALHPNKISTKTKLDPGKYSESVAYYDGMGRQIQSQVKESESIWIVTNTEYYSDTGAVNKIYRPIRWNTGGAYTPSANSIVYSRVVYYNDPLQRVKYSIPVVLPNDGPDGINAPKMETRYSGNATNSIVTVIDLNGTKSISVYDQFGNMVKNTNANGTNAELVSYSNYDIFGRIVNITFKNTGDNLLITKYEYDTLGRLRKSDEPDRGQTILNYDDNGNIINKTDSRKITIKYDYTDPLDRIKKIDYPIDADIDYFYEKYSSGVPCPYGVGRLCELKDGSGSKRYEYDFKGRLVKEYRNITGQDKIYVLEYKYNDAGALTSLTDPEGITTRYDYNLLGQTERVWVDLNKNKAYGPDEKIAEFTYDEQGRLKTITHGDNSVTDYTYDIREMLESINARFNSGGNIFVRGYRYDNVGNMIAEYNDTAKNSLLANFAYDNQYRLINVKGMENYYGVISYTYDAVGNRITEHMQRKENNQLIKVDRNYTYDDLLTGQADSRLTKIVDLNNNLNQKFTYDATGNTNSTTASNIVQRAMTYDDEGRLVKINYVNSTGAAKLEKYTYDSSGMRVKKQTFTLQGVRELRTPNDYDQIYIYGPTGLLTEYKKYVK